MQGNMGYGNNSGYGTNGFIGNGNAMNAMNGWSNGWNGTGMNSPQPQAPVQPQPARQPDTKIIVNGRAAADAYPMPQGSNLVFLWDRSGERLFVKTYDNNGYPCVTEDYDLTPHVNPEPAYVTKDDIREMIEEALGNIQMPNTKNFVTRDYLDKAISRAISGNKGKVNRNDEDA